MMRLLASVSLMPLMFLVSPLQQAVAQEHDCGGSVQGCTKQANVEGDADSFVANAIRNDVVPGRGSPATHGEAPDRTSWIELDEYMTPTCPFNGLHGADALCMAALVTCPAGQIRWWIWHEETRVTRNPDGTLSRDTTPWRRLPGSYCLGSDDPGVPDYGRAVALIQQGFQDLPLPVADVQVDPAPTSLVNIPTAFFAGGAQTFSQTVTPVPGISVTVNARPTQWEWFWGDGTSQTFTTAGVPKRPVVSHVYREATDRSAYVRVTWTGTFSIAGSSEVFDIATPAVVDSAPVTVQVREARTQLVAD